MMDAWEDDACEMLPRFVGQTDMRAVKVIVDNIPPGGVAHHIAAYFTNTLDRPEANNHKGAAAVAIVELAGGWAREALEILPEFVSFDNLGKVQTIVLETPDAGVPAALAALFGGL